MQISSHLSACGMAVALFIATASQTVSAATPSLACQSGSEMLTRPSANEIATLYINCPGDAEIRINGRPVAGAGELRWYPLWTGPQAQFLEIEARVSHSDARLRNSVVVRPGQLSVVRFDPPVTPTPPQKAPAPKRNLQPRQQPAVRQARKTCQAARKSLEKANQSLLEQEKKLSREETLVEVAKQQVQSAKDDVARLNTAIEELARAIREAQALSSSGADGEQKLIKALQRRQNDVTERRNQAVNAVTTARRNQREKEGQRDAVRGDRDNARNAVAVAQADVEEKCRE